MREFPPAEVTLPWLEKEGELVTVRLMFTTRERKALNKNYFNYLWKAALEAIRVVKAVDDKPVGKGRKWEECRDKMMHALRHLFASEAINEGVDVYTLADLLGHEDPAFTLRRYVHRVTGAVEKARRRSASAIKSQRESAVGLPVLRGSGAFSVPLGPGPDRPSRIQERLRVVQPMGRRQPRLGDGFATFSVWVATDPEEDATH